MKSNIILLLICIFMVAFMSTMRDSSITETYINTYSDNRSSDFFPFFKAFFMNQSNISFDSKPTDKKNLMEFLSTFMDIYCSSSSSQDDCRSSISNMALTDSFIGKGCLIETITPGILSNSKVRIMNNLYNFSKCCCNINIESIGTYGNTNIQFRVQFNNSFLQSSEFNKLILTCPVMISLNEFGIFKCLYTVNQSDNILLNGVGGNSIYIERIVSETSNPQKLIDEITCTSCKLSLQSTLYYMILDKSNVSIVNTGSNLSFENNMCLIFDQDMIKSIKTNSLMVNFVLPRTQTSNMLCSSITFSGTASNIFNVSISANNSSTTRLVYTIDQSFSDLISTYPNAKYHIILTYSLDKITIVGLLRDVQSSTFKYCLKHNFTMSASNPVYLQFDGRPFSSSTDSNAFIKMYPKFFYYKNIAPVLAIPNYAHVSKKLGYE